MEHKLILGGEQYLPFARSRIKALRATGLKYASQQFEIDGCTIAVRIAGDQDYIRLEGGLVMALSSARMGLFNPEGGRYIYARGATEGPFAFNTLQQNDRTLLSPDGRWAAQFASQTFTFLGIDAGNLSTPKILATESVPVRSGVTSAYLGCATGRITPVMYDSTLVWVDVGGTKQSRALGVSTDTVKYSTNSFVGTHDHVYVLMAKKTYTTPPIDSSYYPYSIELYLHTYSPSGDMVELIAQVGAVATYPGPELDGTLIVTPTRGINILVSSIQPGTFGGATGYIYTDLYHKKIGDSAYYKTSIYSVDSAGTSGSAPPWFIGSSHNPPAAGLTSGRFTYFIGAGNVGFGGLLIHYPPSNNTDVEHFTWRGPPTDPETGMSRVPGSFYFQGKIIMGGAAPHNSNTQPTLKVVETSSSYASAAVTHVDYTPLSGCSAGAAIVGPRFGFH